ncbi:MAG TPA: hypothetical protein IAA05_02900 [Candidatus Blautia excrementipullorum]|nr:hypothetical protein [Candidatus Blautia excrementipullorum]
MLALKINDVKTFMTQLLIGDTFDAFPMAEASVTTFNTFTIDGWVNKEFYDTDTQDILTQNAVIYSQWKKIKPFCRSIIRGKLLPLQFRIVFQLAPHQISDILKTEDPELTANTFSSFSLNIQYKNKTLLCTTGVAHKSFTLDKGPEQYWDDAVLLFFKSLNIDYEYL